MTTRAAQQATAGHAVITGALGQDGVYLARQLLAHGWRVTGLVNPATADQPQSLARRQAYLGDVELVACDVRDSATMAHVLAQRQPDLVVNLAAISSPRADFPEAEWSEVNAHAVHRLGQAMLRTCPGARLIQASSVLATREATPGAYGRSKSLANDLISDLEQAGLFTITADLYNHESPLRGASFVTRKVAREAVRIAAGGPPMSLGNVEVVREWGFAGDFAAALVVLAQSAPQPGTWQVCTGSGLPLRRLVEVAFDVVGIEQPWEQVDLDPALLRHGGPEVLVGEPSTQLADWGWQPELGPEQVIRHMVDVERERALTGRAEDPAYLYPGVRAG